MDRQGRGIFVTGTDTGVGKTYVSCLLGRRFREEGAIVRPFKPVESACLEGADGSAVPADALALRDALSPHLSVAEVCLYPLAAPLSPHLAARMEGVDVDTAKIRRAITDAAEGADVIIVEGAGGLTVEVREGYSFADLAADLGYPVLVVADNRLGVLNLVRLTTYFLESRGIPLLGIVLNDLTEDGTPAARMNGYELDRLYGRAYLGRVAHGGLSVPDDLFRRFDGRFA